jgi:hypothetical protein
MVVNMLPLAPEITVDMSVSVVLHTEAHQKVYIASPVLLDRVYLRQNIPAKNYDVRGEPSDVPRKTKHLPTMKT